MNIPYNLKSFLEELSGINAALSFYEHANEVAQRLERFLINNPGPSGTTGSRGLCLPPAITVQNEYPYLSIERKRGESVNENGMVVVDLSLLLANHHLLLVKRQIAEASSVFETAQRSFHEFVHPLSHYMKSPLTAILGYSSLLEDELESARDDEIRHYIRRIGENTRILVKMIDDLLYLSRLKREGEEELQVSEIVTEVLEAIDNPGGRESIPVEVGERLPSMVMNREHAKTIFAQLISNALRHSGQGATVSVGYRVSEFFIEDRGTGISPDNLEKVFRIFFTTCSKDLRCTGAGLYIVKKILELYGGHVRIESTLGKGTTVFFRTNTGA